MTAALHPTRSQRAEALLTGLWLALWQVALAATLLRTAGATVQSFFALTATWLAGGVLGARWLLQRSVKSKAPQTSQSPLPRDASPGSRLLLPLVLLLGVGAKGLGAAAPFSPAAAALILAAGAAAGAYAGIFLADRSQDFPDIASLLLTENNGFVLGYAGAFALLLWRAPWLDGLALGLGSGLAISRRRLGSLGPALALGAAAALYYLMRPYVGDRGWDGLMTATVLTHPAWVTAREVLFFAHPLVIPLTAPLVWLGISPLQAAAAREALCAGGVVSLSYLAAAALGRSRRAGVLAAAILTLAVGRWHLATCGEEKEVAMLFGAGFLFLYLDHRGLWDLKLPSWRDRPQTQRRALLSVLLALSVAVHLVNAVLGIVVLADLLLARPAANRRQAVRDGLLLLGGAASLAVPFFLWLSVGPGGARTARQALGYFFEYHLSGEFLSLPWQAGLTGPAALGHRLLVVYTSAREWLLGSSPGTASLASGKEAALVIAASAASFFQFLRHGSPAARRLFGWALLVLGHAFVFDSGNPESVAPSMTLLVLLVSASLFWHLQSHRQLIFGTLVGTAALLGLAVKHSEQERAARQLAQGVRSLIEPAAPSSVPLADLCRLLDAELPRDAILLVGDRLHASYFHIYTRRRPIVADYLDLSPEALRQQFALTSLSLRVYRPELDSAAISAAIQAGRPVYLLSAELRPGVPQRELPWDELHLYTLSTSSPPSDPDATPPSAPP